MLFRSRGRRVNVAGGIPYTTLFRSGLIEVMGRAILPARLKSELAEVKKYLLGETNEMKPMHKAWADQLKLAYNWTPENAESQLQEAVGKVFARVLEDAGVFKRDKIGQEAFGRFYRSL